jgi:DNA-binding response OmpR family regulator
LNGTQLEPDVNDRVIVGDGNVDAAESLAVFLEYNGYRVVTAYTGPDVLEMSSLVHPRFAVIALHLPLLRGHEVCRRLCSGARCPRPQRLIALTGSGLDRDRQASREAGFDYHLLKPVDPNLVLAVLR